MNVKLELERIAHELAQIANQCDMEEAYDAAEQLTSALSIIKSTQETFANEKERKDSFESAKQNYVPKQYRQPMNEEDSLALTDHMGRG